MGSIVFIIKSCRQQIDGFDYLAIVCAEKEKSAI